MESDKQVDIKPTNGMIEMISLQFNKALLVLAGLCITLMMFLIVGNAIVRVFAKPFSGTVEVVGWLAAIAISFSLGYTQLQKGHVSIDLLIQKFHPVIQKGVQLIIYAASLLFFAMVGWQMIVYATSLMNAGTVSSTLRIAFYPLVYLVAIGFIGITFALLTDLIKLLKVGGE
ncbi:TRAP transporter small permease [Alkalihalobacillus sp. MEB130]|uniref:TRAP transporter small permease n=1 Tax=Alkalihalobacillus sp. MEB130 TaxID=2976704 RepID=UPI0028DE2195|nr:TRAP transporter small permease [Alkalihalobacillus sp. MEB130]MDT8860726.1 TRAP transporter small permease [Alkalihalobacillus sp. MEB130]